MKSGNRYTRALLATALTGFSAIAIAQDFPARPMRILVPYTPGGIPDLASRQLAQQMSAPLGQAITVENRPGAGGQLALRQLISAPSDGYTMMVGDVGQLASLPALQPGWYDFDKDVRSIGQATTNALYIVVGSQVAAKTMQEFVAFAKANPGRLSYGSAGTGSVHHIFMEAVKQSFGLDIVHVPFKGSGATVVAALAGDIPMMISGPTPIVEHLKSGRLRLLVGSTRERSKLAPDVPGAAEFGYPDIDYGGDMGYFVPGATPKAVADKLAGALARAVQSPDFERAIAGRAEVKYRTAEQFAELIRAAIPRYQRVVKAAGIKAD